MNLAFVISLMLTIILYVLLILVLMWNKNIIRSLHSRFNPVIIPSEDLKDLLANIDMLPIEQRLLILHKTIGGNIEIRLRMEGNRYCIEGAWHESISTDELIKRDPSIG